MQVINQSIERFINTCPDGSIDKEVGRRIASCAHNAADQLLDVIIAATIIESHHM